MVTKVETSDGIILWLNPKVLLQCIISSQALDYKEGSTTIENIIQKKYLNEEASRVKP